MEIKQRYLDSYRLTISFSILVIGSRSVIAKVRWGNEYAMSCRVGRIRPGWEGDAVHLKMSSVIRRCGVPAVLILKGGRRKMRLKSGRAIGKAARGIC